MSLVVLSKTLKQILSLVFNCEKKGLRQIDRVEGEIAGEQRSQQSLSSMGSVGDRTKDEKNGRVTDPWFN